MDFNSFKEALVNACKNIYTALTDTALFYFIKERYDHLSSFNRKIFHTSLLLIVLVSLFYYPFLHLISSWSNMQDFSKKNELIHNLSNLSSATKINLSQSYTSDQNPVTFLENKIPALGIPPKQLKSVKKSKDNTKITQKLKLPAKVKTVRVEIHKLNLKEVVEYGHKLEELSNNIKLIDIRITEDKEEVNYFNVSYTLGFFSTSKVSLPKKEQMFQIQKQNKQPKKPLVKKKKSQKKQSVKKQKQIKEVELKGNRTKRSAEFDKLPDEAKKRDLIPKVPAPPTLPKAPEELKKDLGTPVLAPAPIPVPVPPEIPTNNKKDKGK